MSVPYPWKKRRRFHGRRYTGGTLKKWIATPLSVIATVLSLGLTYVIYFLVRRQYDRVNDAWWTRGLMMVGAGVLLAYPLGTHNVGPHFMDLLYSFGSKAQGTWQGPAVSLYLSLFPIALALHGVVTMIQCYWFEYHGEKYLERTRPNLMMKRRHKKNAVALADGLTLGDGNVHVGVIADDRVPWRTPRYGMDVGRPIKDIGHGVILGGTGTGKTILAMSLAQQFAASNTALVYLDYKASKETLLRMKAIAESCGVPSKSFSPGIVDQEDGVWYDPLAWDGTPSDKASMLTASFQFSESGDASFYKNLAEEWLTLQFKVMSRVGLAPGESQFDFLLDTAHPQSLKDRIMSLREGSDRDRALFEEWSNEIRGKKAEQLASLRSNLSNVVNAGGEYLRPQGDTPPLSFTEIAENGGVYYIGLSPMLNDVALKIIGSLVLRDIGVLVGKRLNEPEMKGKRRTVIVMVDEASRMGNRVVTMNNILTTSREADIYLWSITQSLSAWPQSTVSEMKTNTSTQIIMRIQDPPSARDMSELFGETPVMVESSKESREHTTSRGETSSTEGDTQNTLAMAPLIEPGAFLSPRWLPNRHAYVMFSGSQDRPTIKPWKSKRVKIDEVDHDVPLVEIIVSGVVLENAATESPSRSFAEEVEARTMGGEVSDLSVQDADPLTGEAVVGAPPRAHEQYDYEGAPRERDTFHGATAVDAPPYEQWGSDLQEPPMEEEPPYYEDEERAPFPAPHVTQVPRSPEPQTQPSGAGSAVDTPTPAAEVSGDGDDWEDDVVEPSQPVAPQREEPKNAPTPDANEQSRSNNDKPRNTKKHERWS